MKLEETSLNSSIINKAAKRRPDLTQRPQLLQVNENSVLKQRYASNIHLETDSKKSSQRPLALNDDLNRKFQLKL